MRKQRSEELRPKAPIPSEAAPLYPMEKILALSATEQELVKLAATVYAEERAKADALLGERLRSIREAHGVPEGVESKFNQDAKGVITMTLGGPK